MYSKLSIIFLVIILCVKTTKTATTNTTGGVLYVWCGQNTAVTNAADFVAVIDFNYASPNYGKVVKTVSLPANITTLSPSGNEAHHAQVSADFKYYITGGLLSFIEGTDEVFVWTVPNQPIDGPTFSYSLNPPGACTDEFVPIGGSQFLVSQMCNEAAGSPGDIIYINAENGTYRSIIADVSEFNGIFNPHGFGRSSNGTLTVTNYILPSSLLASNASGLVFRDIVVAISADGHLAQTYTMPPNASKTAGVGTGNGFMDFKYIPGDPYNRGFVCGTNDNQVYLVQLGADPVHVFDFAYLSGDETGHGGLSAGIISYSQDGKRLVMSLLMKWVVLLNIEDPTNPFVLQQFPWCNATGVSNMTVPQYGQPSTTFQQLCDEGTLPGSHYVLWPQGSDRFIVINYFLKFGLAQFAGSRTVHAFKFTDNTFTQFEYDFAFNPNDQLASLGASPHAVTYFPVDQNGFLSTN